MASILIVEDDMDIAQGVAEFLQSKGHELDFAYTGKQALSLLADHSYELVLLDINLPFVNGFDVCKSLLDSPLTQQLAHTPVIFMSSRSSEKDVLQGFQSGAWDYLVKPFSFAELSARIDVSLLKSSARVADSKTLSFQALRLDLDAMTLTDDERSVQLHQVGFEIIKTLMQQAPNVVKTRVLHQQLWGEDMPDSDPLRAHMYKLRKLLSQHFSQVNIETVKGVGYKLDATREGEGLLS